MNKNSSYPTTKKKNVNSCTEKKTVDQTNMMMVHRANKVPWSEINQSCHRQDFVFVPGEFRTTVFIER